LTFTPRPLAIALLTLAAGLTACQSSQQPAVVTGGQLKPSDFTRPMPADAAQAPTPAPAPTPVEVAAPAPAPAPAPPSTATAVPTAEVKPAGRELVVDAMVGQVNGKPIYASEVFRVIGDDVLARLGREKPRLEFQRDAAELIANELRSRVTNAVILAEAERGLTEQEQMGLLGFIKQQREEILSRYGGVLALAEAGILRDTGRTLDEELEARRQRLLTDKYLREKLYPKIHVNRREVERYYADHPEEFNPAPTVTVRLILVTDEKRAELVDDALKQDASFESVAKQYSSFRADAGGLLPPFQISGPLSSFSSLSFPQLNEAARTLKEGEHSPRVKLDKGFGWVKIEKLVGGESRTLEQAFLEIEARLKGQKFNALSRRYLDQLMRSGNYTPIEDMAAALLNVAMSRYARPQ
jgi:parvulin-like peptidyl-prolyl isomerase